MDGLHTRLSICFAVFPTPHASQRRLVNWRPVPSGPISWNFTGIAPNHFWQLRHRFRCGVPSFYTAGCNAYRVWAATVCWATLEDIGHPSSANPHSGRFGGCYFRRFRIPFGSGAVPRNCHWLTSCLLTFVHTHCLAVNPGLEPGTISLTGSRSTD